MAKIRIFELARDLNMTTKELIGKMEEIDMPAKSHMSSLEENEVDLIKKALFGKKESSVEETRIRPTVIRRRRKVVKKEPEPEVSTETPEVVAEAKEKAADAPPPEKAVETEEAPAIEEATEASVEAEKEEQVPEKEKPAPEDVATIISKPEPVPPEELAPTVADTPSETTAETVVDAAADEPAPIESDVAETEPVESKEVETPAVDAMEPEPVKASEPEPEPEPEQKPEPAAPEKAAKPKRTKEKKKGKKETPAKIIQLPKKPVAPAPDEVDRTPQPADPVELRPGREFGAKADKSVPLPPTKEKKKGKRASRSDSKDEDNRFFKKKISFRKKEVVEGAALYRGGKRGQKGRKKGKNKQVTGQATQITVAKAIKRRIKVDDTIVLADLAKRMGIKAADMIRTLMGMGVMVTVNQTIDYDTAVLVASEFDYEVERASFEEETIIKVEEDDPDKLVDRPPVVTIMGHVDHGKTSLLDVIRKTRITEHEAGGITQHIGAYHVKTDRGQIVFLDTPGHEAFTAMRARGAQVTDLVILVVAADDGVMPQTVEAINHAKASEVPIVVAVNKIDKQNADPDRVQRQLAELGLAPEEWGGDTIYVKVSAKQNQGIDDLLEMILLQAEMLELQANPDRLAVGHVVEAKLDAGRGAVATVLVQNGTLRAGAPVVCGVHYGKIRAMLNDRGKQVETAGPSIPVEIIGLSGVPLAGDELIALDDEKNAKQISEHRIQKQRSKELAKNSRMSLEGLFEQMKEGEVKDLNIIIKADVDGSTEALKDSLTKLSNEEVKINVVHAATGTITESDVSLAAVSNAIIIGFNVRPNPKVADLAHEENVDMRFYNVIYDVIKEVKDAIVGMMASTFEERLLGRATVREVFHVPKVGAIAGSYVSDGKVERGKQVRLLRDGVVQYEGLLASLRRFKDDAKEVQSGYECGIGIANYNDIKVGDVIECFYMEEIRPEVK